MTTLRENQAPLGHRELTQTHLVSQKRLQDRGVSDANNEIAPRNFTDVIKPGVVSSDGPWPVRFAPVLLVRAVVFSLLLCLGSVHAWAQQSDQEQLRGLDEQVQEIKSDILSISEELNRLEEKLLYPSGTQVAIFVALARGDTMRLDAVRLQINGQLVAHHIYCFKELDALRKGGVQRIYIGNVATGDHQLEVVVDGKLESGADFSHTERFTFRKEVKPKMVGLTVAGSGNTPVALGEW
jgi:hypothetical protein